MPIPSVPDFLENVLGYNAEVNTIPSVTENDSGSFSYQSGFPAITQTPISSGGIAPDRKDFNAVIQMLSKHLFWLQSGGLYRWNAALNYPLGCHVLGSDGVEYVCQSVNGPDYTDVGAQDPTTDEEGTYWKSAPTVYGGSSYGDLNETFLQSMIGVPRYWRSTKCPDNHCWANGDFISFDAWPEFKAVYEAGGFEGMLLAADADDDMIAANLGKWRMDSNTEPTGLYAPNLSNQFLRGVIGDTAGATNAAGLPEIEGAINRTSTSTSNQIFGEPVTVSGCFLQTNANIKYSADSTNSTSSMCGALTLSAAASNSIYGNSSTVMPASVDIPIVIYLGASAS